MLETTFHSLTAVLIVMFMVAVGWLFGKLGYLRREHKKLMTKLIISAGMPSLVVNTVFGKIDLDALQNPALLFLLPALSMITTLLLGFIFAKLLKPEAKRRGGFIAMCAFSNSVFVGLPMNTGLFGDEAVPYVMCFYIVNTTLFWTIGNYLISRSGHDGACGRYGSARKCGAFGHLPCCAAHYVLHTHFNGNDRQAAFPHHVKKI